MAIRLDAGFDEEPGLPLWYEGKEALDKIDSLFKPQYEYLAQVCSDVLQFRETQKGEFVAPRTPRATRKRSRKNEKTMEEKENEGPAAKRLSNSCSLKDMPPPRSTRVTRKLTEQDALNSSSKGLARVVTQSAQYIAHTDRSSLSKAERIGGFDTSVAEKASSIAVSSCSSDSEVEAKLNCNVNSVKQKVQALENVINKSLIEAISPSKKAHPSEPEINSFTTPCKKVIHNGRGSFVSVLQSLTLSAEKQLISGTRVICTPILNIDKDNGSSPILAPQMNRKSIVDRRSSRRLSTQKNTNRRLTSVVTNCGVGSTYSISKVLPPSKRRTSVLLSKIRASIRLSVAKEAQRKSISAIPESLPTETPLTPDTVSETATKAPGKVEETAVMNVSCNKDTQDSSSSDEVSTPSKKTPSSVKSTTAKVDSSKKINSQTVSKPRTRAMATRQSKKVHNSDERHKGCVTRASRANVRKSSTGKKNYITPQMPGRMVKAYKGTPGTTEKSSNGDYSAGRTREKRPASSRNSAQRKISSTTPQSNSRFPYLTLQSPMAMEEEIIRQKKNQEYQRRLDKQTEVLKKRQEKLKAKLEEQKRKREERTQRALENRQQKERELMEQKQRIEREEEKRLALERQKDEKLRVDQMKKSQMVKNKMAETEFRRKLEEEARLQKLREQDEEERVRIQQRQQERMRIREMERKQKEEELQRAQAAELERVREREEQRLKARTEVVKQTEKKAVCVKVKESVSSEESITASNAMNRTFDKSHQSAPDLNSTFNKSCSQYEITPDKPKRPLEWQNPDNYDITNLGSDDSTDDESHPRKPLPSWVSSHCLRKAIIYQYSHQPKLDALFPIFDPPDLTAIFTKTRKRFLQRTSSANWGSPMWKSNSFTESNE